MKRFVPYLGAFAVLLWVTACAPIPASPATPVPSATSLFLQAAATPTMLPPLPTPTSVPPTMLPSPPTATPALPTPTLAPSPPTAVPPTASPASPMVLPPTATTTSTGSAASWLDNATILGFYGRGFGVAPILGRVGGYANMDDMAQDVAGWSAQVAPLNGGKTIIPEIHLIYALAIPCSVNGDCLSYFEGMDPHLVDDYIKPAQARGWQVFLDTQLGRSDPVTQVKRMIDKGYLQYDNVEVALDPEFHVYPGHVTPGIPVGTIEAAQVNDAQALLDSYVRSQHLPHRKVLVIHQFGDKNVNDGVPFMISNKSDVRTYPDVDLVFTADGVGSADAKVSKYNAMLDSKVYPIIQFRGLKVFPINPYEQAGHYDHPLLTFRQVYGLDPTSGKEKIAVAPNLIIIN